MKSPVSRRKALTGLGAIAGLSLLPLSALAEQEKKKKSPSPKANIFTYCLNTSTIMGQNLGIEEEINITAKAGYDGIEI